jgi:hypothetical protein
MPGGRGRDLYHSLFYMGPPIVLPTTKWGLEKCLLNE